MKEKMFLEIVMNLNRLYFTMNFVLEIQVEKYCILHSPVVEEFRRIDGYSVTRTVRTENYTRSVGPSVWLGARGNKKLRK